MGEVRTLEDIRHLYDLEEFASVVKRVDRAQSALKKKKDDTGTVHPAGNVQQAEEEKKSRLKGKKPRAAQPAPQLAAASQAPTFDPSFLRDFLTAAKAAALIQLNRFDEAITVLEKLRTETQIQDEAFLSSILFNRAYALYAVHRLRDAESFMQSESKHLFPSTESEQLQAQLLYRNEKYLEAGVRYETLLKQYQQSVVEAVKAAKKSKSGDEGTDLERARSALNEVFVNYIAARAMSGYGAPALLEQMHAKEMEGNPNSYEVLYNAASVCVMAGDFENAKDLLNRAEALAKVEASGMLSPSDDMEGVTPASQNAEGAWFHGPIIAQKAFVELALGHTTEAQELNIRVVQNRSVDPASMAVSSNNLACLSTTEKDANLFDLAKRMKVTSREGLSHKLTPVQKQLFGLNRALIFLRMGRLDAAKAEIAKLASAFSSVKQELGHSSATLNPLQIKLIIARFLTELAVTLKSAQYAQAHEMVESFEKSYGSHSPELLITAHLCSAQIDIAQNNFEIAARRLVEAPQSISNRIGVALSTGLLFEQAQKCDEAESFLCSKADSTFVNSPNRYILFRAVANMYSRASKHDKAMEYYEKCYHVMKTSSESDSFDALAHVLISSSYVDGSESRHELERYCSQLKNASQGIPDTAMGDAAPASLEPLALEWKAPPKRKADRPTEELKEGATDELKVQHSKKKRKRKPKLPKNYDPDGPPPDPERWLPKYMRSGYKKRRRYQETAGKGIQGGDTASTAAFSEKQEKASQAAKERIESGEADRVQGPKASDHRPKGSKQAKKKGKK